MRRLGRLTLAFGGATLVAALLPLGWGRWLCLPAAGVLLYCLVRRREGVWLALGLLLGFSAFALREQVSILPASRLAGERGTWRAEAVSYPETGASAFSVLVKLDTPAGPVQTRLYAYDPRLAAQLRPGDGLTFEALLCEAGDQRGEGTLLRTAELKNLERTPRPDKLPLRYRLLDWGEALKNALRRVFPEKTAGLAVALVTGDKNGLTGDRRALQRAGLLHLATVSGLHISILAGFFFRLPGRRRAALLATPLLLGYAGLVGFTPSAVRAVVMQLALLSAPVFRREGDPFTALGVALVLLLLRNPYAVLHTGLQLSFAATLGILLFAERLEAFLRRPFHAESGPLPALCTVLAVTLSALSLTVPISALTFGAISLVAPLANLLTAWAVAPALLLSALAGAVGLVNGFLGTGLAWVASVPLRWLLLAAHWLGEGVGLRLQSPVALLWLTVLYALLLSALALRPEAKRLTVPVTLMTAALCLLVLLQAGGEGAGYALTALDVGQGQCLVITSGQLTGVIDCGSNTYNRDPGQVCLDYLEEEGRKTIDLLLLTHYDYDHISGVAALLDRLPVGALLAPVPTGEAQEAAAPLLALAAQRGVPLRLIAEDTAAHLGETTLTLYAALEGDTANDRCLGILVENGGFETLVTGDMSAAAERRLLDRPLPDIECLVVGHHGSATSTDPALLAATKPELALISVGRRNRYGHPAEETLNRLRAAHVLTCRTDEQGSITITTQGDLTYG